MSSGKHVKSGLSIFRVDVTTSTDPVARVANSNQSPLRKHGQTMHHVLIVAVIAVTALAYTPVEAFETIYVKADATGDDHGTSWGDAYNDLQDALAIALPGDEIWVAAGTYRPAGVGGSREATFQLLNDVALYGGFAGNETSIDQREIAMNETILSGDLNGNDVPVNPASDCCVAHSTPGCDDTACAIEICASIPECCSVSWSSFCTSAAAFVCGGCSVAANFQDNSFHVVTGSNTSSSALIDGFTITRGYANVGFDDTLTGYGAGMLNRNGEPTVRSCKFIRNTAKYYGAGMYNLNSSTPTIEDCLFAFNSSTGTGLGNGLAIGNRSGSSPFIIDTRFEYNIGVGFFSAAVFSTDAGTSPAIVNCQFTGNEGVFGGAVSGDTFSSTLILNTSFIANRASIAGGAIYNNDLSETIAIGCLFSGNHADENGGAFRFDPDTSISIINCTFTNNTSPEGSGLNFRDGDNMVSPSVVISSSVFWGNGSGELDDQIHAEGGVGSWDINHTCIQGIDSTVIGNGNIGLDPLWADPLGPDGIPGTADDDLRLSPGSPCIDAGDNTAVPFDIFDLDNDSNTTERTPIDLDGNPRFLDDAATTDTGVGTAPIVDMGAYEFIIDCNQNHIPDSVDIASGNSPDVNQDGIPDECGNVASIVDATPPPNAIDARQPHNLNGSGATGWYFVRVTLSNSNQSVGKSQFEVTEQGGDGIAPGIAAVSVSGTQALVLFNSPIEPGAWTTVTHVPSGTSTRVGYLPGDVNGDGTTSPVDILALIDSLNGVTQRPDYATDINRDGSTAPADILREIDLLNGADAFEPWLGRSLP